jgi:malonyl CoA-acyl carrier protein transacylase/acyl carrier protein/NAD(P)-dependent dehydrogenase (short-subunit alcohol dehydrogenase family)
MESMQKKEIIDLLSKQDVFIGENLKQENSAFLFPGHGSQYPNMLKDLIENVKVVKDIFDEADKILSKLCGEELTPNIIYKNQEEEALVEKNLKRAKIMQTSIYTANYAMYKLLESLGMKPDYLCGHSLGEISALVAADVISFSEGLKIVYYRAESLERMPEDKRGGMVSISIGKDHELVSGLLNQSKEKCVLALNNAQDQIVLSGSEPAIKEAVETCKKNNLSYNVLRVSHAFHSDILIDAVDYYYEKIKDITYKEPKIAIYSTIKQRLYDKDDFEKDDFARTLASQLITPFSFCDIVKEMYEELNVNVYIEVGCKNILTRLVKKILSGKEIFSIETNLKVKDDNLCIKRLKTYMDVNNITLIKNDLSKEKVESDIKKIIMSQTSYPLSLITISHKPMILDLALNKTIFDNIVNKITRKFNLDESVINKDSNISLKEIIDIVTSKGKAVNRNADEKAGADMEVSKDVSRKEAKKAVKISSVKKENIEKEIKEIVAEKTGYPEEMLESNLDLEADLGIDSVKQGEIFAVVREHFGYEADENANIKEFNTIAKIVDYTSGAINSENDEVEEVKEAVKINRVNKETIEKEIKEIVAEKTGYPEEMLESNLDLEADLGIDSVKQGEIFVVVREHFGYEADENANIKEFNTIAKIVDYTSNAMGSGDAEVQKVNKISKETIEKEIKEIVAEKTGYPEEMLESNLDLEADLGIDSVKQGEIFAVVREHFGYEADENANIKEFNTIAKIVDYTSNAMGSVDYKESLETVEKVEENKLDKVFQLDNDSITTRYMGISVEKKYPDNAEEFSFQGKRILLVEDNLNQNITRNLVELLKKEDVQICILGNAQYEGVMSVPVDFEDIDNLKVSISKTIEKLGKVDVVINLNGIRKAVNFYNTSYDLYDKEVREVYNVMFYTSKYAYKYFEENPKESAYFAATNIGGIFGAEREYLNNPIGAIVDGYLKGVEKELRPLNCKICDFTDVEDVEKTAKTLYKDYKVRERLVEIGYCNDIRKTICVIPKEIKERESIKQFKLDKNDVVLVSGGGRGIILECVKGLAALYNPKIIITGRTELPNGDEEWLNFNEEEIEKYKTTFIRKLINEKKIKAPFEAVEKYNKLLNARELYKNIEKLNNTGYNIHYVKCDICSDEDTKKLSEYIKKNFGKVTGIINGAGLPSFGKITNKNEQFALKVVRVKADGFYNMYNKFKSDKLKFFISMGSISGRFGMDGQVDYSAGADIIVKLSSMISKDNPDLKCGVLGWTAWDEVGMASDPQVQKVQKEVRGLEYIKVKEGVTRFLNEVAFGLNYPEILFFGKIGKGNMPLGQLDLLDEGLQNLSKYTGENGEITDRTIFPMLETVEEYKKGKSIVCKKELSKKSDVHLRDHLVEGSSVFAGVMHIEAACELGVLLQKLDIDTKEYYASEIVDYNFNKFVKYYDTNKLVLKLTGDLVEKDGDKKVLDVKISSDFINKKGFVLQKDRIHSNGNIIFEKKQKVINKTNLDLPALIKDSKEMNMDLYYEKASNYIVFGKTFRCISYAGMLNENEMVGVVRVPGDEQYFSYIDFVESVISPVTVDNIGRFMLLNDYQKNGYTIVPRKITKAVKYREFKKNEEIYVYCKLLGVNDPDVMYSAQAIGKNGEIIFEIDEMILTRINRENGNHNILK